VHHHHHHHHHHHLIVGKKRRRTKFSGRAVGRAKILAPSLIFRCSDLERFSPVLTRLGNLPNRNPKTTHNKWAGVHEAGGSRRWRNSSSFGRRQRGLKTNCARSSTHKSKHSSWPLVTFSPTSENKNSCEPSNTCQNTDNAPATVF
jgi:hypothetical protein